MVAQDRDEATTMARSMSRSRTPCCQALGRCNRQGNDRVLERGLMASSRASRAEEHPWMSPMAMVRLGMGSADSRAGVLQHELPGHVGQVIVEPFVDPLADRLGNAAVERLGDPSRHAGQGVAVSPSEIASRTACSKSSDFQESPDRLRDAVLTRHLEAVPWADLVQRSCRVRNRRPSPRSS